MQDLDFFCEASEQSVREQVEKLRALRKLTDEQASAVDVRAIVRFLRSDLAARIRKNAQTVRREYRFSLLRPVREALTGTKHLREGQKCLLRSNMLHTYYRNKERSAIRQYEYENFLLEYRAYKALRGNSFIDRIYQEVKTWDIVP